MLEYIMMQNEQKKSIVCHLLFCMRVKCAVQNDFKDRLLQFPNASNAVFVIFVDVGSEGGYPVR